MKAAVMVERAKEYAVILAFDVKIPKEVRELADENGVTIFDADIIYHLFDKFTEHMDKLKQTRKEEAQAEAVWPVRLKIIPEYIINKKDPMILGVHVLEGTLKMGTPICVINEKKRGSRTWKSNWY